MEGEGIYVEIDGDWVDNAENRIEGWDCRLAPQETGIGCRDLNAEPRHVLLEEEGSQLGGE